MKEQIEHTLENLQTGKIVGFPTETGWGLICSPKEDLAVEKLKKLAAKSANTSLELLVNSEQLLQRYVREIPEICFDLIDCAVKPLTIVYPNGQYVSKQLLGNDQSLPIRLVSDELSQKTIQRFKQGIAFIHYPKESLNDAADYIVALQAELKFESAPQIIKIKANSEFEIIRS